MPKSSSRVPSRTSQITFKNEDEVYHVTDEEPGSLSSKHNVKNSSTSAKGSKASLKEDSKSSTKGSKASMKEESKSSVKESKASMKEESKHTVKESKGSVKETPKSSKGSVKGKSEKSLDKVPMTSSRISEGKSLEELTISPIPSEEHVLKAESGKYIPTPYIFRSPAPDLSKEVKRVVAKCPPYYLQLDHTLAVIWTLFSKDEIKKPLGIVQLQWALSFLEGIYNRKGEHPKDVALCIQAIQDELIEQYADIVDEVQYIKRPEEPQTTDKRSSKAKKPKSKSKPEKSSSEGEIITVEEEITIDESSGNCNDDTCTNKICAGENDTTVTKRVPFSINYAEMMCRNPPDVEQLYPCCNKASRISSIGSGTRRSVSGIGASTSHDNMMEFLKSWRREQVEKIQAELKRLKSIENFIGSAESENFSPYLDEKQLDSLVAQKVGPVKSKSTTRGK